MRFIVGPIIHRQKFSSSVKLEVVRARTSFRAAYRGSFDWGPLLNKLVHDERRNAHIARIADREIQKGNTVLVLSRRIEHLHNIAEAMQCDSEILAAATRSKADRKRVLADFTDGKIQCVLATQLADEALDVPRLNRVLLTHPGKHEGRIIQQIGRALRRHSTKEDAVIYDFVDRRVRVLRKQANDRLRTYKKEGIPVRKRRMKWRSK
jgi:superfamily II DNA or RNA helicase